MVERFDVVDEAEQVRPALLARLTGVRQPGPEPGRRPARARDLLALEAPVGGGTLGQQAPRLAGAAQVRGEGVDIDGVGVGQAHIALQDVHQGLCRAGGLLLAQHDGAGQHFRRERPRDPGVPAGYGAEGLKAAGPVGPEVAAQGDGADLGARRVGNAVALGGNSAQQRLLAAGRRRIVDELGNEAIPEQRDFGVQVGLGRWCSGFGGHDTGSYDSLRSWSG